MESEDEFCVLMRAFDEKCKCIQKAKYLCFCLLNLKKINAGEYRYLHDDNVIYHRSDGKSKQTQTRSCAARQLSWTRCGSNVLSDHKGEGKSATTWILEGTVITSLCILSYPIILQGTPPPGPPHTPRSP